MPIPNNTTSYGDNGVYVPTASISGDGGNLLIANDKALSDAIDLRLQTSGGTLAGSLEVDGTFVAFDNQIVLGSDEVNVNYASINAYSGGFNGAAVNFNDISGSVQLSLLYEGEFNRFCLSDGVSLNYLAINKTDSSITTIAGNVLDDGSGNAGVSGDLTIGGNVGLWNGNISSTYGPMTGLSALCLSGYQCATYCNLLDDGSGNMSVAGVLYFGANGAGATPSIAQSSGNTLILGDAGENGEETQIIINDSTGYITTSRLGTQNQVLDDGHANMSIGNLTLHSGKSLVFGDSTAQTTAFAGYAASSSFTAAIKFKHIGGNTTAPTKTAGTGAGTSPTITVVANSTDVSGNISVTTGTTPAASAAIVTITFNAAFTNAPFVVLEPTSAAAAALTGNAAVYVTKTTTTFVINAGSTALTAATVYSWDYHILGN